MKLSKIPLVTSFYKDEDRDWSVQDCVNYLPTVSESTGTRSQMMAVAHWGMSVASKGRPVCGNCLQPMDPEGHFCPRRNGHKY